MKRKINIKEERYKILKQSLKHSKREDLSKEDLIYIILRRIEQDDKELIKQIQISLVDNLANYYKTSQKTFTKKALFKKLDSTFTSFFKIINDLYGYGCTLPKQGEEKLKYEDIKESANK